MLSRSTNKVGFRIRGLSVKRICCFHLWVKSYHYTYQCQNCSISCPLSSNRSSHTSTKALDYVSAPGKKFNFKKLILFNLKTSWNFSLRQFYQTWGRANNHSRHWVGVHLAFQNVYLDDENAAKLRVWSFKKIDDCYPRASECDQQQRQFWFIRSAHMTTRHISITLPKSYTATNLQLDRCCSQTELVTYSNTNTKITSIIQEVLVLV